MENPDGQTGKDLSPDVHSCPTSTGASSHPLKLAFSFFASAPRKDTLTLLEKEVSERHYKNNIGVRD